MDVSSNTTVKKIRSQPGMCFLGKGLGGTTKMRKLRRIDTGEADMDLLYE
jgi:hypothetical protein